MTTQLNPSASTLESILHMITVFLSKKAYWEMLISMFIAAALVKEKKEPTQDH